ncbi:hypothetical protein ACJX0J_025524, partial [Zea mays]
MHLDSKMILRFVGTLMLLLSPFNHTLEANFFMVFTGESNNLSLNHFGTFLAFWFSILPNGNTMVNAHAIESRRLSFSNCLQRDNLASASWGMCCRGLRVAFLQFL